MHQFSYVDGVLHCEQVPVPRVLEQVPTPFYLYSVGTAVDHFLKIKEAFAATEPLICFALKANANLALGQALAAAGCGADIVSGGELFKARRMGIPADRVVYAGVGKTRAEIEYALTEGIRMFNVESEPELEAIAAAAARLGKTARCALRVNPDVDAHTHAKITTGRKENKFGLSMDRVRAVFRAWRANPHVSVTGLHCHLGSQITEIDPYLEALAKLRPLIDALRADGGEVDTLNLGGGLGIEYRDETPSTARAFAEAVLPAITATGCRLILEPGRFIVGNAGVLITSVTYIKEGDEKNFVIVDAGMNDLVRPAMYDAYHEIRPVADTGAAPLACDVVGPICESSDVFGKDRTLPRPAPGDALAIFSAGAYGFTMSSNYNARPRPAEVVARGDRFWVTRPAESHEDLVRNETGLPA